MNTPKLTDVGSYTITVTTTDQHLLSDVATTTFIVHGLSIDGYVDHTATWKSNWVKYNQHLTKTGKPTLGAVTFFTGEKYVLSADTTTIKTDSVRTYIVDDGYWRIKMAF